MSGSAPEFRTKPSTPVSPIPLHPPEPSNIPVLQNQIDPVFNMTSTHLEASEPPPPVPIADTDPAPTSDAATDDLESHDDANLSDLYDDAESAQDTPDEGALDGDVSSASVAEHDEYAKTFDSDAEDAPNHSEPSQPTVEESAPAEPPVSAAEPPTPDAPDATSLQGQATVDDALQNPPCEESVAADSMPAELSSDLTESATTRNPQETQASDDNGSGGIDIQQLLDTISATANSSIATAPVASPAIETSPTASSNALSGHSSLPPRPPALRGGNSQTDAYYPPPPSLGAVSSASGAPSASVGAPGTVNESRGGLSMPPAASFTGQSALPTNPISSDSPPSAGAPFTADMEASYEEFLAEEKMYVSEGVWDRFPVGSRLFIGNLPTEKVSKQEVFRTFCNYGKLAQISLKQAYGFVQFHTTRACYEALEREQGTEIGGRKMHLEISKPQKNTGRSGASQRSNSPEHSARGERNRGGRNERNRGGRDDGRGQFRSRDDYRPRRSPSPRGGRKGLEDYGPSRGRNSHGGRDRARSRSRSPYGRRENRYRERSMSPRLSENMEDSELPLPRRAPHEIPDVQFILMDELDRDFVAWVDNEVRSRGVKTHIMFLSPRLPLGPVVRRQILEGVHAVSKLTRRSQDLSKIPLQVFDRKGGANNVRFDEYQDLEPRIASELILRAKMESSQSMYPQPQYHTPQPYQPPAPALAPPVAPATTNLASLVGQLDNATMQKLLSALSAPQQNAAPPPVDLAGLLGALGQPAAHAPSPYAPQPMAQPVPPSHFDNGASGLASLLGGTPAPPSQPHQPAAQEVQNIMAQLAKYRQ